MTVGAKVVITGASGHIGFHVAGRLLAKGYDVHLLLRSKNTLTSRLARQGAVLHLVELGRRETYASLLHGSTALFHLAAANTTSQQNQAGTIASTAGLTRELVETAIHARVGAIIYTSSVVVLGRSRDPARLISETDLSSSAESPYVRGKSEAESYCRAQAEAGADLRIVYPSWVVGPDDPKTTPPHKLILDFVSKGQPFYFPGGISIAHVEDVADAHVAAFERGSVGGRYVLGGNNVSFRDFFHLLAKLSGRKAPRIALSKSAMLAIAHVTAPAFKLLGKEPPADPAYVEAIVGNYSWYDSGRAQRELGYRIRPLEQTLAEAVRYARMRQGGTYELNLKLAARPANESAARSSDPLLLITGAPGWLGSRMIDILSDPIARDRFPPARKIRLLVHPASADMLKGGEHFEVFPADLNDRHAVSEALAGVGSVFHLAGAIYPPRIATLYKVNAKGTRNLVDACIERGVRRILYMSTDSICGHGTPEHRVFDESTPARPFKHYGKSKWQGEDYLLRKTGEGLVDGTSLRGFWFFGPYAPARQLDFLRMFNWPRQVVFGDGKNLRSISHVDDIVRAFLAAEGEPKTYGRWYWIGDKRAGYTVDEIYGTIATALGRVYRPLYVPKFVSRLLGFIDDLLAAFGRLHPAIHAASKFHFDIAGSSAAAARDFGYVARVSLEDAALELRSPMPAEPPVGGTEEAVKTAPAGAV